MRNETIQATAIEKKSRVRLGGLFVLFLIMTVAGLVFEEACDAVLNPWAHSLVHAPVVTGSWLGHIPSLPPQIVFLTMYRPRSSGGTYARCRSCPDVEGWFRFCGATGIGDPYRMSGNVGLWLGSGLKLWFNSGRGPDFSADEMPGTWNHGDVLTLTFRESRSLHIGDPPPVTRSVVFHHADEAAFLAGCAQAKQQ